MLCKQSCPAFSAYDWASAFASWPDDIFCFVGMSFKNFTGGLLASFSCGYTRERPPIQRNDQRHLQLTADVRDFVENPNQTK
jgi:hypothetical protein